MPAIVPVPVASPLKGISPTGAEALRTCFLQASFNVSPEHKALTYQGPAARLGRVCHTMLEDAIKGLFGSLSDGFLTEALNSRWHELIQLQREEVGRSPLEQHLSHPERWPYYELKRAHTFRLARHLATTNAHSSTDILSSRSTQSNPIPPRSAERWYQAFGGRLRGRVDQVRNDEGETVLIDYKTGTIFEDEDSGEGSRPRENYRRQLLLYSALHWSETGAWPSRAELISIDGQRAVISIDPQEALALVDETLQLLDQYNQEVRRHTVSARPEPENCAHCRFQGLCTPMWDSINETWCQDGDGVTVAGIVDSIEAHGDGSWSIKMKFLSGDRPRETVRLLHVTESRFNDRDALHIGQEVRIVNGRQRPEAAAIDISPIDQTELWWEPA